MWLESSEAALERAQCRPDRGDAIGFGAASPSTVRGGAWRCVRVSVCTSVYHSVSQRITAYLCVSLRTSACVCERVWNWRMLLWRRIPLDG